ncbi:hypothetical protein ACA910_000795 [Epithemia clementina (nom. ined.)]
MGKGALIFKGDEKAKKKKKKVKHEAENQRQDPGYFASSSANATNSRAPKHDDSSAARSSAKPTSGPQHQPAPPKVESGKGQITTSGTVVTGHNGTEFLRQMRVGDAVLVGGEMRVVTMFLSDVSINLSSAFSSNYVQPTNFQYISKPRAKQSQAEMAKKHLQQQEEQSKLAAGTYSSSNELVYRQKTEQGSYRIVKKALDHEVTRGDLLEMRTKKKSDKYC